MFANGSHKSKQFFVVLIKFSIVVAAFYFIYHKLTQNENLDFPVFIQFLSKNTFFTPKNFFFLLALSFFNWFFEISKWKVLVSSITKISYQKAVEQVLGSLTASLFTPNRIGEYGAKAMYFAPLFRKRILLINLLGNLMQMCVTLVFGCVGLWLFTSQYHLEINYLNIAFGLVIAILIIAVIVVILRQNVLKIKGFTIENLKQFFKNIPLKIHAFGLVFSLFRYLIFSFQFYYLLTLFGVDITYFTAMTVITSMYVLASVIPSIFIFDVVVRGSIAVYLFAIIGVNELTVLYVITLMWLLNFVCPSILGGFYVLKFKLPKNEN